MSLNFEIFFGNNCKLYEQIVPNIFFVIMIIMVPKADHHDRNMTNEAYETLKMSSLFFFTSTRTTRL